MTFWEYYNHYESLHQNRWCRRLHGIGNITTLIVLATIIKLGGMAWFLLPIVPFVIYPFAWTGHFVFERNQPAAFKHPIRAKICDWIMFSKTLTGKLPI